MRIALDAMGGDHAPSITVAGALMAVDALDGIEVLLVGDEGAINRELKGKKYPEGSVRVISASEVILMDDSPSMAIRRKPDSSMRRAVELVKKGEADAAVSAGNSGAAMALAMFLLGPSEGVIRPAIATFMPGFKTPFLLLDAGANVDCAPENLFQFALMGEAYYRAILNKDKPAVAVLSIGEEESKGNELTKETCKLLKKSRINFLGNIESKDVFMSGADVIVCDGFVGNIFLKTSEGLVDVIMKMLGREVRASVLGKLGYLFMKPTLRRFSRHLAYDEYGGAPLLGINGACLISHGRSNANAIKNAIRIASEFSRKKVCDTIAREIKASMEEEKVNAQG